MAYLFSKRSKTGNLMVGSPYAASPESLRSKLRRKGAGENVKVVGVNTKRQRKRLRKKVKKAAGTYRTGLKGKEITKKPLSPFDPGREGMKKVEEPAKAMEAETFVGEGQTTLSAIQRKKHIREKARQAKMRETGQYVPREPPKLDYHAALKSLGLY